MIYVEVNAQSDIGWLEYLKSVKNQFYYKDTIILTYQPNGAEHPNTYSSKELKYLHNVKDSDLVMLFYNKGNCSQPISYFSYYLSKSDYATLTFITAGKYVSSLSLFNYSPEGKLLKCFEIKSWFIDAGIADSTSSNFMNDSTIVVRRWDGYELEENGKPFQIDSITTINYVINQKGQIIEGDHSKEINKIASDKR